MAACFPCMRKDDNDVETGDLPPRGCIPFRRSNGHESSPNSSESIKNVASKATDVAGGAANAVSSRTSSCLAGFRDFLLRGSVVDLAIAVVIGTSFQMLVQAFVADWITPWIGAMGGTTDFSQLSFSINNSVFNYGDFLNKLISFIIVALVCYFFVVVPLNALANSSHSKYRMAECPDCLSDVPAAATRCKFCLVSLTPLYIPRKRQTMMESQTHDAAAFTSKPDGLALRIVEPEPEFPSSVANEEEILNGDSRREGSLGGDAALRDVGTIRSAPPSVSRSPSGARIFYHF